MKGKIWILAVVLVLVIGTTVAVVLVIRHKRPKHKYKLLPTSKGGRCVPDDTHGTIDHADCNKFTHNATNNTCVPDPHGDKQTGHCDNKVTNQYYECNGFQCIKTTSVTDYKNDPHCNGACKQPLPAKEIQFTDLTSSSIVETDKILQLGYSGQDNSINVYQIGTDHKSTTYWTWTYDSSTDEFTSGSQQTITETEQIVRMMGYGDTVVHELKNHIVAYTATEQVKVVETFGSTDKLLAVGPNTFYVYDVSRNVHRYITQPSSWGSIYPRPEISLPCVMGTKHALIQIDIDNNCETWEKFDKQLNGSNLDMKGVARYASASLDGRRLVVASNSHIVYYEANSASLIGQNFTYNLKGHLDITEKAAVQAIAISQDGKIMAYAEEVTNLIVAGVIQDDGFIKQTNIHVPQPDVVYSVDDLKLVATDAAKTYLLIMLVNDMTRVLAAKIVIP
jgi:hypothetical protein